MKFTVVQIEATLFRISRSIGIGCWTFLFERLSGKQYKQAERIIDVVCMWSLAADSSAFDSATVFLEFDMLHQAIASPAWAYYILPFFLQAKKEDWIMPSGSLFKL